ncbi:hypothetical protein MCOR25_010008 [Pyricularia grisea]|uniref:Mtf2-like C-terminal domain-containing protein n=1 Tax=Pyricularia grisea TaxID=148305 RepID=A0A6P8BFG1_PYRGI|nr:uncharacterized protein PgNI_00580 [Pyricularia grisea]KAI6351319.1 hypothetical protein MCOR25_010008 [Pyricularia grisea]TLD15576.1 hypothetical protein PgNI_00580 [Pyricularia grisea]
MATTMLPFLYQTRTIQRIVRSTPARLTFSSLLHTTSAHHFSCSSSHRGRLKSEDKFNTEDPIPFELPEDLAADPRFNPQPENDYDEVNDEEPRPGTITPKERQAFDHIFKEISRTTQTSSGDAVTTTKDDFSLSDSGKISGSSTNPFQLSAPREQSIISSIIGDAIQGRVSDEKSTHRDLLKNMRQLHNIDPFGGNADSKMSAQERYEKLLSFPPSLRDAAKRALGILKPEEKADSEDDFTSFKRKMVHPEHMPLNREEYMASRKDQSVLEAEASKTDETGAELVEEPSLPIAPEVSSEKSGPPPTDIMDRLDHITKTEESRIQERDRVNALMLLTKSDFELWDVLEREVFSMVSRLGLDAKGTPPPRSGKKSKKTSDSTSASVPSDGGPRRRLDLAVHGPLYSSHIIAGLKTMDQRYPGSSLALAILPRVKSLGLASYILGASVDLYTAQMNLHWNRYRDVRAVLDLMDEMKSAELLFDKKHLTMLEEMERAMVLCLSGKRGEPIANIIASPEWASLLVTRIVHLKGWIKVDLKNRGELPLYAAYGVEL